MHERRMVDVHMHEHFIGTGEVRRRRLRSFRIVRQLSRRLRYVPRVHLRTDMHGRIGGACKPDGAP